MGKSPQTYNRDLQDNIKFSSGRTVRAYDSAETRLCFNTRKHRGSFGRGGNAELARVLQIGMGSAYEAEYHALLAKDLGFMSPDVHTVLEHQIVEVKRMLAALLLKVRAER